jgi:signal transduction histidine kinase
MEKVLQIRQLLLRSRRLPWLVLALTLGVLAGVIALTTLQVRQRIRAQIAGRDGEVLYAVAQMQYAEDVRDGLAGPISDPGNQLTVVLKSAELKGVMGARLFDAHGQFVEAFPPYVGAGRLAPDDLPALKSLRSVSHFLPVARPSELFLTEAPRAGAGEATLPVLLVNVPLHVGDSGPLAGIAQFILEGHSIAAEYARLDRHLAWQALAAFGAGGGLLTVAFGWAFRRLRRAHERLAERTESLVKANQELALAAKTSALGAVAAHLIHGLKNPLAGLQSFVASRHTALTAEPAADWQHAVASTRRMQALINQVVGILREDQAGTRYEVSLAELGEMLSGRLLPLARERGAEFTVTAQADAVLPNRVANLVTLILVNLAENALEATPRGRAVTVVIARRNEGLSCEVHDQGPGFPATQPLFTPCPSTKEGGGGIGLALCKQLAQHLGAALELRRNTPEGCVFALTLPLAQAERGRPRPPRDSGERSNDPPLSVVG